MIHDPLKRIQLSGKRNYHPELSENKNDNVVIEEKPLYLVTKNNSQHHSRATRFSAQTIRQKGNDPPYLASTSMVNPRSEKELWEKVQGQEVCKLCNEKMFLETQRSIYVCRNCGFTEAFLEATTTCISRADDFDYSSFSYQRLSHFNDRLTHAQAKEKSIVPGSVIETIRNHPDITCAQVVTLHLTKMVLKLLKLRKYYRHNTQIWSKLTGNKPLRFSPKQEEELRLMFKAIQGPFDRHRPTGRSNFLSYSFALYKFCELLGYDDFLMYFPLLKGRDKLKAQMKIWKLICDDLGWRFIDRRS